MNRYEYSKERDVKFQIIYKRLAVMLSILLSYVSVYAASQIVTVTHIDQQVLHRPSAKVSFPLSEETQTIIEKMRAYMLGHKSSEDGGYTVGLAAPQMGYNYRIIMVQIPQELAKRYFHKPLEPFLMINPEWIPFKDESKHLMWEGCLSNPDLYGQVMRYATIHYQAYNLQGEVIKGTASGLLAHIIQHETDHLNGMLFSDKVDTESQFLLLSDIITVHDLMNLSANYLAL